MAVWYRPVDEMATPDQLRATSLDTHVPTPKLEFTRIFSGPLATAVWYLPSADDTAIPVHVKPVGEVTDVHVPMPKVLL